MKQFNQILKKLHYNLEFNQTFFMKKTNEKDKILFSIHSQILINTQYINTVKSSYHYFNISIHHTRKNGKSKRNYRRAKKKVNKFECHE